MDKMTDLEMRDLIFRDLYNTGTGPDFKFGELVKRFEERSWRYDPDLENDLIDEMYRLAEKCGIHYYKNGYYVFDGKIYVSVDMEILESTFKLWCTRMNLKIAQKRKKTIFKDEFMAHIRIANHLQPRLDIVAFKNGVLDLNTYEFNPFSPDYHVTYYHPYRYDPKAKCRMWQAFLKEVLPDSTSRMILQMFLGLGLIERGTVYNRNEGRDGGKVELCLMLVGAGANGKSVIYDTAMGIFGKSRISACDYGELTMAGDEGMRARVMMRDAIFNWCPDTDSRTFGKKNTGVFKRIVSGEPVTDRKIGENVQNNYHMPYLIFNLNELPGIDEGTLGFIRRLQIVSFDVTIPHQKQNKTLALDLKEEYPGIFNWVMRGMREVRRRKFLFPSCEKSYRQMLLMQLKMNPIVSWCNAYGIRCQAGAKGEQPTLVPTNVINDSVYAYCEDNDAAQLPTKQKIGNTLGYLHFEKKRVSSGYRYALYGVSVDDLKQSFVIQDHRFYDEVMEELDDEEETYIDDTD
jgi:P4 family phage/plasmid primase-like protien